MRRRRNERENIAAYLAGRMSAGESRRFEQMLSRDRLLANEVDELRSVAAWTEDAGANERRPAFRLSPDRRAALLAAAGSHIVSFPETTDAGALRYARARRRFPEFWTRATAVAAAIVFGAFFGLEAGRQRADMIVTTFETAPQIVQAEVQVDYPATVYPYPPAYGLDRDDSWRFHISSATSEFALAGSPDSSTVQFAGDRPPTYYGLPGPRSPYLATEIRGEQR